MPVNWERSRGEKWKASAFATDRTQSVYKTIEAQNSSISNNSDPILFLLGQCPSKYLDRKGRNQQCVR